MAGSTPQGEGSAIGRAPAYGCSEPATARPRPSRAPQSHGGQIDVATSEAGTTLTVTLPVLAPEAAKTTRPEQ
jgi:hypothetical protein